MTLNDVSVLKVTGKPMQFFVKVLMSNKMTPA